MRSGYKCLLHSVCPVPYCPAMAAAVVTDAASPLEGVLGGRVHILNRLSGGAFAEIYSAKERDSHRLLVVKAIRRQVFEHFRRRRQSRLSIYDEYINLCSLLHPNIITACGAMTLPRHVAICMEHIPGLSLFERAFAGMCDESLMVSATCGLVAALAYIHSRSLAHRDIKPENVMTPLRNLDAVTVKLIDFGLAYTCTLQDGCRTLCGTYVYTAPEIRRGLPYGYAVDLWALGVLVYACISGELPACSGSHTEGMNAEAVLDDEFSCGRVLSVTSRCFVSQLVRVSPSSRSTAAAAKSHPWLLGSSHSPQWLPDQCVGTQSSSK